MVKHYGEDLRFEQDVVTVKKYKKKTTKNTKKSSLSRKPEKAAQK